MFYFQLFAAITCITGVLGQPRKLNEVLIYPEYVDESVVQIITPESTTQLLRGSGLASQGSQNLVEIIYVEEIPQAAKDVMTIVQDKVNSLVISNVNFILPYEFSVSQSCRLPASVSEIILPGNTVLNSIKVYVGELASDGPSGTLASAGPCVAATVNNIPMTVFGVLLLDLTDVTETTDTVELTTILLHEMLHVLGFGTLWNDIRLVEDIPSEFYPNPIYTGKSAIQGFGQVLLPGDARADTPIPVEDEGLAGSAGSHWRTSVFDNELMTAFLTGVTQPLSIMTAKALQDLGYSVDLDSNSIDPYQVPGFISSSHKSSASLILSLTTMLLALSLFDA